MAARASNILVCWERRITGDGLQTGAGAAPPSRSSFQSFHCWNLSHFKQVRLTFRRRRARVAGLLASQVGGFVSGCSPGEMWRGFLVKNDAPPPAGIHQWGGCTSARVPDTPTHAEGHTTNSTDNKHVDADVMSESCSACP